MMREIDQYCTENDYDALFNMLKSHDVVCFVKKKGMWLVCEAKYNKKHGQIDVSTVGMSYICAFEYNGRSMKEDFIEQCRRYDLRYIPICKNTKQVLSKNSV